MKKNVSIGIILTTVFFSLSYILIIVFENPLVNIVSNNIITTIFSLYFLIMTGYWIYCILNLLLSATGGKYVGISFLFGMILFFGIPLFLQQGLLTTIGICLILLNMIFWATYYIIKREFEFLLLIYGFLVILLTFPYCSILWD